MNPQRSGRGRPKGTGLDDTAYLQAISGLMASNPDLKPTTAIKELGITDPSVIRRLRDKFHAAREQTGAAQTLAQAGSGCLSATPARTMAIAQPKDDRLTAPATTEVAQTISQPADDPARAPSHRERTYAPRSAELSLAKLFGISVGLFVTSIEAQASLFAYCLNHAPVGAFYSTQVAFADAALSFASEVLPTPASMV